MYEPLDVNKCKMFSAEMAKYKISIEYGILQTIKYGFSMQIK